jgi:cation diffusion facilitator CzcD-associated flavoprotein CzcO
MDQKIADVIVVGAGISGLVAAEFLKSRDDNLSVLVLVPILLFNFGRKVFGQN